MNKELIYEIVMPDFPRTVKLSDARRAKYFKPTDKLSLKYLKKDKLGSVVDMNITPNVGNDNKGRIHELDSNFIWKEHKLTKKRIERRLYDLTTKDYIVKNPSVAGTPNIEIINGQKMYNGDYHPHTRDKIMKVIHEYMIPFLQGFEPITEYPLIIDGFMYDKGKTCEISKGRMFDIDNRQFCYNKAFQDMLQYCGIIKQDDFEHIIGAPRLIFRDLDYGVDSKYTDHFPNINLGGLCPRTLVYQIYKVCQ